VRGRLVIQNTSASLERANVVTDRYLQHCAHPLQWGAVSGRVSAAAAVQPACASPSLSRLALAEPPPRGLAEWRWAGCSVVLAALRFGAFSRACSGAFDLMRSKWARCFSLTCLFWTAPFCAPATR
jgi:hypothetical protein